MKIDVKVVPGAKIEKIESFVGNELKIWVKGKPKEGEANICVIKLLADYFETSKSNIKIISGFKNRNKIIEITE